MYVTRTRGIQGLPTTVQYIPYMSDTEKLLALFEDHEPTIRSVEELLAYEDYKIVVKARNMRGSMEVAAQLNDLGVIAALVDGNLTDGERGNWEGAQVTAAIHEKSPGVVVVGYASMGQVEGADYNPGKSDPQALFDVLAKIFS